MCRNVLVRLQFFIVRLLLSLLLTAGFAFAAAAQQTATYDKPRLAVLIIVDQMRPDHITRFEHLYTGGFARMLRGGSVFLNGFHHHSATETAVGHATIATGTYPLRHGIVANRWWDTETGRSVYCIEDSTVFITGHPGSAGVSVAQLQRLTLGDWVKARFPESKVLSFGLKDRAVVLMAGFRGDLAYWFDARRGIFVTSAAYTTVHPQWLQEFNDYIPPNAYFLGVWQKLLPEEAYRISGPDNFHTEYDGIRTTMPHLFLPEADEPESRFYDELRYTPFADHMVTQLAMKALVEESLGTDSVPDLLYIACSAPDYIGHRYGPESHEVQDYYMRLDRYLGELFTLLDAQVGREGYLVILTSDHGVLSLPELLQEKGIPAGRYNPDTLDIAIRAAGERVAQQLHLKEPIIGHVDDGVYLDYRESDAVGVQRSVLRQTMAEELRNLSIVEDTFTKDELVAGTAKAREYASHFRNSHHPTRSPDVVLRFRQHWIITRSAHGTTHGSCYSYDTDVPILFYGGAIKAQRNDARLETVAIAPTIAELLGVVPPPDLDGRSLKGILTR